MPFQPVHSRQLAGQCKLDRLAAVSAGLKPRPAQTIFGDTHVAWLSTAEGVSQKWPSLSRQT